MDTFFSLCHRRHLLALGTTVLMAAAPAMAGVASDSKGNDEGGGSEDEPGISYGGSLAAELIYSPRDGDWPSNADLSLWLEADLGTLLGAEHWYAFVNPTLVWGAEEDWEWKPRFYQAWLSYDGNDQWNFLVGQLDPGWHFHSVSSAALCVRMPSRVAGEFSPGSLGLLDLYPISAPAMRLEWKPHRFFYLQAATFWLQQDHAIRGREILREVASGKRWLVLGEGGWNNEGEEDSGWKHFRAAVGGWVVPALPETWGLYAFTDKKLWTEPGDWQGLSGFLSLSTAHTNGHAQEHRAATGLLYEGLLPSRDEDSTAFALIAEHPRHLAWEVLHRFALDESRWLQLSLQWQDARGEEDAGQESWRVGIRLGADF